MTRICEMAGVREYKEKNPVELHRNEETGRLVVLATNEGGNNITEIDLFDLVDWLKFRRPARIDRNAITGDKKVA